MHQLLHSRAQNRDQGKHDDTFRYASNPLFGIIAIIFLCFSSLWFDVFGVAWTDAVGLRRRDGGASSTILYFISIMFYSFRLGLHFSFSRLPSIYIYIYIPFRDTHSAACWVGRIWLDGSYWGG